MSSISRRSVAKGAAWAVPAVLASSAIPAYAASRTQVSGTICQLFYGAGASINYQVHNISLGIKSSTGLVPAGTTITWKFTMSGTGAMESPTTNYSQNNNWSLTVSPAPGTQTSSFTVVFTANKDMTAAEINCGPRLIWNDTYSIKGGNTISMTSSVTGALSSPSGLSYVVANRYPSSVNSSGRTAHKYLSKSGGQACYPDIQYVLTAASKLSTCGNNANDTSTVYPDGSCDKITATTAEIGGQKVLSGRC